MNIETFIKTILGDKTNRDLQIEVGPSEILGCKRKVWHRFQQTPRTNQTLKLASWMGTAIHKAIERAFDKRDPFYAEWLREEEVTYNGLMGHVDLYDVHEQQIVDWKTTAKKNLSKFPSDQQKMQAQIYGYLMNNTGRPVTEVALMVIARDGNERDIRMYAEPYDESVALEGLAWLEKVRNGKKPEPEKTVNFCRDYCDYFDPSGEIGCTGK